MDDFLVNISYTKKDIKFNNYFLPTKRFTYSYEWTNNFKIFNASL